MVQRVHHGVMDTDTSTQVLRKMSFRLTTKDAMRLKVFCAHYDVTIQEILVARVTELLDRFDAQQAAIYLAERGMR